MEVCQSCGSQTGLDETRPVGGAGVLLVIPWCGFNLGRFLGSEQWGDNLERKEKTRERLPYRCCVFYSFPTLGPRRLGSPQGSCTQC